MTNEAQTEARTAHTPGPWQVVDTRTPTALHPGELAIYSETGYPVATVRTDRNNPRANARLIAQAPAMLDLLREYQWSGSTSEPRCIVCEYHRDEDGGHAKDCDLADVLDRIAARGEA